MLPWESKELDTIKNIRHQLVSMWSYTELELDDVGKDDVMRELDKVSSAINDIVKIADVELDRLIKRDAEVEKLTCSHCESHKITICEPCLVEMNNAER